MAPAPYEIHLMLGRSGKTWWNSKLWFQKVLDTKQTSHT